MREVNSIRNDGLASASVMTRRRFLQDIAKVGGVILGGGLSCGRSRIRLAGVRSTRWVTPAESQYSEVRVISGSRRELKTTLRVAFAPLKIGNDKGGEDAVSLRAYNASITGPTLRAKPGDKLIVDLINELPEEHDSPNAINGPHGLNITNLHSHGLHVSPEEGDNVFLEIGFGGKDGTRRTLIYDIPEDHPRGTFWYHPHKHGSVAVQVASGMAGALIIEGDIDQLPEIAAAQERIFIFQQIPYNVDGKVGWDEVIAKFPKDRYTTINGQLKPRIEMHPGEVQRWRFIHAGIKEKLTIALVEHQLSVIAHDGITTGRRDDLSVIELYPGYRADVLVKASKKTGTYKLYDQKDDNGLFDPEIDQELADVVVNGEERGMNLPEVSQLEPLAPLEDLRPAKLYREPLQVKFNIKAGKYIICGREFNPGDPPLEMKLDGVDEWVLSTENKVPPPPQHPFHIHVNPFQVIAINGKPLDHPLWRDTVIVERDQPVTMRTRCRKFTGESVMHCHILDHEDRGMMLKIKIVDGEPQKFPCP
jgi:FtsP/CotA-like multicopper oxidase with cupredoxin domain